MTDSLLLPEVINVWLMVVPGVVLLEKPATFPELPVAVQVNNVPVTLDVRLILVDALLQMLFESGVVERLGLG